MPPRRIFFEDSRKPAALLHIMCELWPPILERSGYQVSLKDPTSHHLFAFSRPRQSQSRWPSALKAAVCNKPIINYNLHISDFYIDDLRPGQFLDLISQWGKNQVTHFLHIPVVIANSIIDDMSHDHHGLPRCKFGYVRAVRSCDVIKGHKMFFARASHRKKLQHRAWSHFVQHAKTHLMIYILTFRSRKGHVTWGHLMTLILWGHDKHIQMRINERISMVLLVLL